MSTRLLDEWETANSDDTRDGVGVNMVTAVASGTIEVGGVRETIRAGVSRIWRRHEWLRSAEVAALFGLGADSRADWFLPADQERGHEPWRI